MKSKAFYFFDLAVHAVNLIFLMTIHFPQIPEYDLSICKYCSYKPCRQNIAMLLSLFLLIFVEHPMNLRVSIPLLVLKAKHVDAIAFS